MVETYISLMSASISGLLHVLLGYPFDTLKTRKQSIHKNQSRQLQHVSTYKGVKYPLFQNSIINSTTFGLNNYFLNNYENKELCNVYTALCSTIILAPLDKFKIMSQYNMPYTINVRSMMKSYKNIHILAACEIPATFLYFNTYHKCREREIPIFFSGAFAGVSAWLFTYPIDTIKVRMQNESCKTINEAYRKGRLYSGLPICILRSFFVNGVNFYTYESLNHYLSELF